MRNDRVYGHGSQRDTQVSTQEWDNDGDTTQEQR